jgi:hypothetical protein
MENNKKLTLEAPWNTYRKMINALFEYDPEIEVGDVVDTIGIESVDYTIDIKIKNHRKFEALQKLLPVRKDFGSVKVAIYIYDMENNETNDIEMFKDLFRDNPIVSNFEKVKLPDGSERNFVCFRPEVIQFYDDDISDCYRNYNGLAEDIARAVFGDRAGDVSFSTGLIQS